MSAFQKAVSTILLAILVLGFCACDENPSPDPSPIPPSPFPLGEEDVMLSKDGETIVIEPFGQNGEDFIPLCYIADYPFTSLENGIIYLRKGDVGGLNLADFYGIFSTLDDNNANGEPDYVNSPDKTYEYKWVKVKCYKQAGDSHTKLVITADHNPTGSDRFMFLYFTQPDLGCVSIMQTN